MSPRWASLLLAAACALAACAGGGVARAAQAGATPAQEQAAYDASVSADDGFAVYDPLRSETLWATGDATMVDGADYSRSLGYPHMLWDAQTGPAAFTPLRLYQATVPNHYGWQPVPDPGTPGNKLPVCSPGAVFWAGGLLYAAGARQVVDYGMCVSPSTGAPAGSYAATFDAATLAFKGLRALGFTEGLADAVPAPGGWWLPGSRFTFGGPSYADMAWVPAGDQNRPWDWAWSRDVVPDHALPGGVFSVFTQAGRWLALTEPGDEYAGTSAVELSAPGPRGPWAPTGKSWPLPGLAPGCYAYSVVAHPPAAAQLVFTFATTCPYRTDFEGVSP